jgi:hypothetical protein
LALKAAFIRGVAILSFADEAVQLLDRIEVRQRSRRLDEVSVVALAPTAKPPHHGWLSFLAARLPAACASASHMYAPRFVFP